MFSKRGRISLIEPSNSKDLSIIKKTTNCKISDLLYLDPEEEEEVIVFATETDKICNNWVAVLYYFTHLNN